ncbi:hypothetical protein E2562_012504 [Oryza meyeriana var. granulata]|uniref:Uncharacterized protein n=1 Tax=Oryza meyeriana var. granulata TaxID=110450 RepID=A0A6G1BVZ0_9ORYZ|nr:hypothetical protein E2562_012504 [Oryza meyeriana var. granulata]
MERVLQRTGEATKAAGGQGGQGAAMATDLGGENRRWRPARADEDRRRGLRRHPAARATET